MMRSALLVLAILVIGLAQGARAQDSLELKDGRRLRGELLSEREGRLRFVTRESELLDLAAADVVERKDGRRLARLLEERLAGHEEDVEQILEAARWASEDKKLAADVERLYRRALALDPEADEARRGLGQVKFGGVWYADEKEGMQAWGKILAEEGYVRFKAGFVPKTELAALRRDPSSYMLDDERRWRPVAELMRERGMKSWQGEWYKAVDEGLLLGELEGLDEAIGVKAQAQRHRGNEVYMVGTRFAAEKIARKLTDARLWIARNLDVPDKSLLDERAQFFCLADRGQYRAFLQRYGKKHRRDADKVKFCLDLTGMSFGKLDRVTDQEQTAWANSLVSGLAAALARRLAPEEFEVPAAFWVAAAMRAEEEVMGEVKVHFVAQSRYDADSGPAGGFSGLEAAKKTLLELRIRRKTRPMSELLTVDVNALLPAHELQGYFLLGFLIDQKKPGLLEFWKGAARPGEDAEARFRRAFTKGPAEIETEFWAWFDRLPR